MRPIGINLVGFVILSLCLLRPALAELKPSEITKLVMLGTGTPFADPERSGPSTAIVVNGMAYIVDFGPGVIRRASAMSALYGGSIDGLQATWDNELRRRSGL